MNPRALLAFVLTAPTQSGECPFGLFEFVEGHIEGTGPQTAVFGDFDGDGWQDLALGVPSASVLHFDEIDQVYVEIPSAGVVHVFRGSPNGLIYQCVTFHQESDGVPGTAEANDRFGYSLAVGNFNGDTFADLAVAVHDEGVIVLKGSANGLNGNLDGQSVVYPEVFGASALVAGDFSNDGYDDLAVGVRASNDFSGTVYIFCGSAQAGGLTAVPCQPWSQDTPGIDGGSEDGDRFGASLAVGDFNGDDYDDLAIGVPLEDIENFTFDDDDAGAVNVIYGSANGLRAIGNQLWTQDGEAGSSGNSNIEGVTEENDVFGSVLAVGDFNHDTFDDLAVGVPGEVVSSLSSFFRPCSGGYGMVNIIFGSVRGLTGVDDVSWTQDGRSGCTGGFIGEPADLGHPEDGDWFGDELAVGDFDGDGDDDLAIQSPGEDPHGLVNILLDPTFCQSRVTDVSFAGDFLAAGAAGPDSIDDLVVGGTIFFGPGFSEDNPQSFLVSHECIKPFFRFTSDLSLFPVLLDGGFSDGPGAGEWSDVLPLAFAANEQVIAKAPDDPTANSLWYATLAPDPVSGEVGALYLMYAFLPRKNSAFEPGEVIAALTLPLVPSGGERTVGTVLIRSGMKVEPIVEVDLTGDGNTDMSGEELGIRAAIGFGPSALSQVPHLLVEVKIPLSIPAGFGDPGGPLPPEGLQGVYPPGPAVWTAKFAADQQPLVPGSGGQVWIHPDGSVTMSSNIVERGVNVNVTVDCAGDVPGQTLSAAIMTTASFNATALNPATVRLGNPADWNRTAEPIGSAQMDADGDGDLDLILTFFTSDLAQIGISGVSPTVVLFTDTILAQTIGGTGIIPDSDGDGVVCADVCPESNPSDSIVIDGCDTGIENALVGAGCVAMDLIMACAADAPNHGDFVSRISELANSWHQAGFITGQQMGQIVSCAAQADLPRTAITSPSSGPSRSGTPR